MDAPAPTLRPAVPGRLASLILLGLLLPAAIAGCRDADGGGPLAAVVAPETRGSLRTSLELPSLPGLVERAGEEAAPEVRERGDAWVGRWQASWLAEPSRGRPERRELYDEAAEPLARSLGPDGVRRALDAAADAVDAAGSADLSGLPAAYRARVDEARSLLARGRRALGEGRAGLALRAALQASDRMRAVSPEGVARALLRRARQAREGDADPARSEEERRRIDRLVRGAGIALEEGDHTLALRRAYYACRLLGVDLP